MTSRKKNWKKKAALALSILKTQARPLIQGKKKKIKKKRPHLHFQFCILLKLKIHFENASTAVNSYAINFTLCKKIMIKNICGQSYLSKKKNDLSQSDKSTNRGLISEDRSTEATLLFTIPRSCLSRLHRIYL